ncbi:hypothetical protein KFK09_026298 [Dendrobium nobile]|uniref:Reverse transcriptase domain-containing protein n=1 Tax=Dendrobium nobile TaxID=94219 RepID=A0A8T3A7F4_DENNO|nr:hypothetical protein KFK09_026298 [Dendrobium nobile]
MENLFPWITICYLLPALKNRLRSLLIIGRMMMGFVKGRAITENILLAQELSQDLDVRIRGGNVILKLDIAKAYDNINWNFIYFMLELFGFNSVFINLIKKCIKNVYFFIILNGSNHGFFKSSLGLRKGDPISPALYIIAAGLCLGVSLIYLRLIMVFTLEL